MVSRTRTFIIGVLPALAIVIGTRTLVAEAFRIPSGSMEPTLLVGDWLFVNKLRFGPHIPLTDRSLPGYASPNRGDVIVVPGAVVVAPAGPCGGRGRHRECSPEGRCIMVCN